MSRRMQGTPWHIGYVKASDDRRHRSRCIYFIPKRGCKLIGNCCGSSHCEKYKEEQDTKIKLNNVNETYEPKSKGATHLIKNTVNNKKPVKGNKKGIKVGDTVELVDPIDGFEIKVQIVGTGKACLEDGKISVDSPIGKAVLGKRRGDMVALFMDENVVYEIVGWEKGK